MSATDHFNKIGIGRLPGHLGIVVTHADATEIHAELPVQEGLAPHETFLRTVAIEQAVDTVQVIVAPGFAMGAFRTKGAGVALGLGVTRFGPVVARLLGLATVVGGAAIAFG